MYHYEGKHSYSFPTSIRFGAGVIEELPAYLKSQDLHHPQIVTDPVIRDLDFIKSIVYALKKKGIDPEVFSDMHKNPVKADVLAGADHYHSTERDSILGIGGGVAMDVARAVVLRVNHHRDLFDYDDLIGGDKLITEDVPHFATVPTTSGTGSEVGRSAIISEDESKKKRILFHPKLMAKMVFADPMLTMELPRSVTAATGMDALTHNLEAYLAKNYHPMSDGIALEGISLILDSIEAATHHPDEASRSKMMIASLMGAVAFQKGLGIVHSLAHPLSSLLDTHHGLANAVNLPHGLRFNYEECEGRFDAIGFHMGLGATAGDQVCEHLEKLNERLEIPSRLSDIGVEQDHIDELAALAAADFCHPNNPKPVSEQDFRRLYQEAL